jgi:Putative addiction module component
MNYSRMSVTSTQAEHSRDCDSHDQERIDDIEAHWASESEERIDAVDRGELQTIDGPSVLRDLRSSLME